MFHCEAHPSSKLLAQEVRKVIGINGGVLPWSMPHGCTECTHVKRYRSDLIQEGAVLGSTTAVVNTTDPEAVGDQVSISSRNGAHINPFLDRWMLPIQNLFLQTFRNSYRSCKHRLLGNLVDIFGWL